MKIDFTIPTDGKRHELCFFCHSETVTSVKTEKGLQFQCNSCDRLYPRRLVIDDVSLGARWWIDVQTKELWQESVGIFLRDTSGKLLVFERLIYPYSVSILSGHLEGKESAEDAIHKELVEEIGFDIPSVQLFVEEDLVGDECSMGVDCHRWHLYTGLLDDSQPIVLNNESKKLHWLTLDELTDCELTYPVKHFITTYGAKLLS